MSVTDVDTVATDADVNDFLGGQVFSQGSSLVPVDWGDTVKIARQHAFDRALEALRRRTPPINEFDLADKTELKRAVIYGTAEHLYRLAMTSTGQADVFGWHAQFWGDKFEAEITGLTPTLSGGLRGTAASIEISRR